MEIKKPLFACVAMVALAATDLSAFAAESQDHKKHPSHSADSAPSYGSAEKSKSEGKHFSGNAHWYGGHFHGKRTASGEVFDKHKMTCAHPSLPFGTHVRVKSLHTGKEVVVRVTDRCPRMSVRCIDLSEGAARKIGIYPTAPGKVKCEVLSSAEAKEHQRKEAEQELTDLKKSAMEARQAEVAKKSIESSRAAGEEVAAESESPARTDNMAHPPVRHSK